MATTESAIEKYLIECVKKCEGVALKLVPFRLKGIPDRLIILPGPRIIFAEVKRPEGGVVSRHQWWWRDRLVALGCEHAFVRTRAEVDALLKGRSDETEGP
jgi:hypothetical protein